MHEVVNNYGMNLFIQRVYQTTGLSVMGALTTAQICASLNMTGLFWPGVIASIGGIIAAGRIQPTHLIEEKNGYQVLKTVNPSSRLFAYSAAMAGLGMTAAPFFQSLSYVNPAILPISIGITAALFGGASLYAYRLKPNQTISWGSSLQTGLYGLIGLNVMSLLGHAFYGPNLFSKFCSSLQCTAGIGIFSAFIAYDTHVAIASYRNGNADHLDVALSLSLDAWNLLIRVAQMLSLFTRD